MKPPPPRKKPPPLTLDTSWEVPARMPKEERERLLDKLRAREAYKTGIAPKGGSSPSD